MYRNTYVEVNLENIAHNVRTIVERYKYKYYIGVVKGNAYGHGYGIIKTLKENGVNFFAVSNLDEALEVRSQDKEVGILCLEPIDIKYLNVCSKNNISICLSNYEYFKELKKIKYNLKIHLKIDSGMNRLGFNDKDRIDEVYEYLTGSNNLYLEGVFTHFATSGMYDKCYDNQIERFKNLTSDIDLKKIDIVHLGRSVTMCLQDKIDFANGIRLGIIMYGIELMKDYNKYTLSEFKWKYIRQRDNIHFIPYHKLGLKPAFSLISEVLEIKDVKAREYVGYGFGYMAPSDMKVAIVEVGYADGISKKRRNTKVAINGRLYTIIDVCMGMIIVKIDDKVSIHDKVTIIGDKVDIKTVANWLGTSSYETMCMIDSKIERKYV